MHKYSETLLLKECKEFKYTTKKKKIMNKINQKLKLDKSDDDKHDYEYIYHFKC